MISLSPPKTGKDLKKLVLWLVLSFMLCFTQIIRKKAFPLLFLSVPAAMNVLVCIASPINASIRYELPLIAMLPLLLGLTTVFSVPIGAEIKQENRGKDASANE